MSTFGVIVTNRNFFPDHLVKTGRKELLELLRSLGHEAVIVGENETPLGAVMTYDDACRCAELFRAHSGELDGIIVCLPNFGDEVAVTDAIRLSGVNVPVLVQACADRLDALGIDERRDAWCGKLSVCSNLYQNNIPFTDTTKHVCDLKSPEFRGDIERFAAVCRVVKGLRAARIGAVGARPDAFHTVRFSEKLLQSSGISTIVTDMSVILNRAETCKDAKAIAQTVERIRDYGKLDPSVTEDMLSRQAKLILAIEGWVSENRCTASAVQCWDAVQNFYGVAACLSMSMMTENGLPSACEMDVTGALSMLALSLASGKPSLYQDWNNNFADEPDVCINIHCSNYPKSVFDSEPRVGCLELLGATLGTENCFGCCIGHVAQGPMTFLKISTDDAHGRIRAYIGEGAFTDDKPNIAGGAAVCRVPDLRGLMGYLCQNGFEHHVALNHARCADIVEEALSKYMGWDVYRHGNK